MIASLGGDVKLLAICLLYQASTCCNCLNSELGNITDSSFLNFQDERVYLRVLMPLGNKEREQPMFFSKVST